MDKFSSMKFGRPYKTRFRRKRIHINRWSVLLLIIISIIYCVVSTALNVYPIIEDISQKMLEVKSTEIINTAVLDNINGDIYGKLMSISYNDSGQITAITTNSEEINKLKSTLSIEILKGIEQFGSEGFAVPIGNLTDIVLLSGIGPEIPFRIVPYGNVRVDFRSQFTDAGINQTRHEVYIDVTADLRAISAVAGVSSEITTSVMVAQTVIVGDTPQFFAGK